VAKNQPAGKKAVEWALDDKKHRRPGNWALIFDWCSPLMTKNAGGPGGRPKLEKGPRGGKFGETFGSRARGALAGDNFALADRVCRIRGSARAESDCRRLVARGSW